MNKSDDIIFPSSFDLPSSLFVRTTSKSKQIYVIKVRGSGPSSDRLFLSRYNKSIYYQVYVICENVKIIGRI